MEEKRKATTGEVVRSVVEELKKVAYVGAAAPYVVFGKEAETIVGGATIVAIAIVWFTVIQIVAHVLLVAAEDKDKE